MYLTTISGRHIDPLDLDNCNFWILDIAHALSRIVRFNGHQKFTWTVAQHSLCCAILMPDDDLRREALLHDATEAYLCDIPTPIKSALPDYQQMEHRLDGAIRKWAGLPPEMSAAVRQVDGQMLVAEAALLHRKLWIELGSPEPLQTAVNLIDNHLMLSADRIARLFVELA